MKRSDQIGELAKALAAAQGEITVAPKDNTAKVKMKAGGEYTYSYSTLADVRSACRDALAKNGLAVVQGAETDGPKVSITTLLIHSSGQWVENTLVLHSADGTPQAIGSCITYGRRYELGNIVGVVADEDDDGAGASGKRKTNGHNGNSERPAPIPAKPAEAAKEDPSVALCTAIKGRILKCPSVAEMVKLDTEIADAHKAHSINDKQKAWLGEIVSARLKDIKLTQEQAA